MLPKLFRLLFPFGLVFLNGIERHFPSWIQWLPSRCPFHALTGFYCPTCGLTRAILMAVTGQWKLSLQYHPLGVFLLGGACVYWCSLFFVEAEFFTALYRRHVHARVSPKLITFGVVIYIAWGLFRGPLPTLG